MLELCTSAFLIPQAKSSSTETCLPSARGLRALFADRLAQSLRTIGHSDLSLLDECDCGRMVRASLPSALVALGYLKIRRA